MMIWHPRSEWVTSEPVTGPPLPWSDIDVVVVHYTAAPNLIDGDPGERWDRLPAYFRQIHHDYLTNRHPGYSIGYNVGVDARGDAWELRGFDIKAAATMGHNSHTFAVLLLVDGQDEASPAAVATVVELVGMAASRAKRSLLVRGHRDFAATQCPGSGIYAQVAEGMFNAAPTKPTPPPAPPSPQPISAALSAATQGDIMMRFVASKDHPSPVRWVLSGAVRITPTFEAANYLVRTGQVSNGLDTADMLTDAELAGLPVVS